MSEDDEQEPLRGYLLIHVGGYKQVQRFTFHVFDSQPQVSVPDRLVLASVHDPSTPEWIEDGWAVGDNPRDRFCKWGGVKPMRQFKDFDAAVSFIHRLRQKRKKPHEVYTLVYVTLGSHERDVSKVIFSLDDIDAFEAQIASERTEAECLRVEYRAQFERDFPANKLLTESYGRTRATTLSSFLCQLRDQGADLVKAITPKATYYRNIKDLRALGLLPDASSDG
mgnify:CR=1 FL=1